MPETITPTQEDRYLVKRILDAYHTTRLSGVPPVAHILSKPYVRETLTNYRIEAERKARDRALEEAARVFADYQQRVKDSGSDTVVLWTAERAGYAIRALKTEGWDDG